MNPDSAVSFYNERYAHDYMESWPPAVLARIRACIEAIGLPQTGVALDYGCGSGALTGVIAQVLPGWTLYGTDLSPVALEKARAQHPAATFFALDDPPALRFDFIFSHHVLEHVDDLAAAWAQIVALAAPTAHMLHILPCGNPGSFEHRLVSARVDGIDPARGGRYFYEDPGHLRRLTSADVTARAAAAGFEPVYAWFANQEAGALHWMTSYGPDYVAYLCDPAQARDPAALAALAAPLRRALGRKQFLLPLQQQIARARAAEHPTPRQRLGRALGPLLFNRLTQPLIDRMRSGPARAAAHEWATRRTEANGSAMYLAFRRR